MGDSGDPGPTGATGPTGPTGPTFADYRAGTGTIEDGTDTGTVLFAQDVTSANYVVLLTFDGVPSDPGVLVVTSQDTHGFTFKLIDISTGDPISVSADVHVYWLVIPSTEGV